MQSPQKVLLQEWVVFSSRPVFLKQRWLSLPGDIWKCPEKFLVVKVEVEGTLALDR